MPPRAAVEVSGHASSTKNSASARDSRRRRRRPLACVGERSPWTASRGLPYVLALLAEGLNVGSPRAPCARRRSARQQRGRLRMLVAPGIDHRSGCARTIAARARSSAPARSARVRCLPTGCQPRRAARAPRATRARAQWGGGARACSASTLALARRRRQRARRRAHMAARCGDMAGLGAHKRQVGVVAVAPARHPHADAALAQQHGRSPELTSGGRRCASSCDLGTTSPRAWEWTPCRSDRP